MAGFVVDESREMSGAVRRTFGKLREYIDTATAAVTAIVYKRRGVGTTAQRNALTGMTVGDEFFDTTLGRQYVWTGTWTLIGGRMPRVNVGRTVAQSVPSGTPTIIGWDSESFDTDSMHDNVTLFTRLIVPAGLTGRWRVEAQVGFAANATGTRAVWITVNGVSTRWTQSENPVNSASAGVGLYTSRELMLNAGDYVELVGFQSSGINIGVVTSTTSDFFAATYMGPQ